MNEPTNKEESNRRARKRKKVLGRQKKNKKTKG